VLQPPELARDAVVLVASAFIAFVATADEDVKMCGQLFYRGISVESALNPRQTPEESRL